MKAGCAQIASGPFLQPRGRFTWRLVPLQLQAFTLQGRFRGLAVCPQAHRLRGFVNRAKGTRYFCTLFFFFFFFKEGFQTT